MAPVEKRFTISETGSTSSMSMGARPEPSASLNRNSPRSVSSRSDCSLTRDVYCLNTSYLPSRVACWSRNTVSGSNRWSSPSRRHWYSPPISRSRWEGAMPSRG